MAVPKKKTSTSRRGMRNAHRTISLLAQSECKNCGTLKIMHHMCPTCGYYNDKRVMISKIEKRKAKVKTDE